MLEELDGHDTVELAFQCCTTKIVRRDVSGDDLEILEILLSGLAVDVFFLRPGIRESRHLGAWKYFCQI